MCIQPEGRGCVRGGLVLCRMSLAGFLISHVAASALVAVDRYVGDGYMFGSQYCNGDAGSQEALL